MQTIHELVNTALTKWMTSIFGWVVALILANGAVVHVLNMLGKGKMPWRQFPRLWQVMDVVLLVFNLVVIFGLVFRFSWSIYVLFVGLVLLQILPYTLLRSQFVTSPNDHKTLNGLIVTELVLLAVFAGLIYWQGNGGGI